MEFGLPTRKVKQEKYPNDAVITITASEENKSNKIMFNPKAYETLGLKENEENEIAISFVNSLNEIYIMNANEYDSSKNFKLKKNGTFANKKCAKLIKDKFEIDESQEVELTLKSTTREFNGNPIYKINIFKNEEDVQDESVQDEVENYEYIGSTRE